jgi:CRP-like cAMP-binding protein
MQSYSREYGPKEIVFREGDPSADLLYLESGRILICTLNGTEVKALAYISAGEFIGELSFFDSKPRSTHIITTEKSKIIQIPKHELSFWQVNDVM